MPSQNIVYKGNDNPIGLTFSFDGDFGSNGLSNFSNIEITIGGEAYSLVDNPDNVIVLSGTDLDIAIGADTLLEDGAYFITIVGYTALYDDGYVLNHCGDLSRVQVKTVS